MSSPITRVVPWAAAIVAAAFAATGVVLTRWPNTPNHLTGPGYAEHAFFIVGLVFMSVALTGIQSTQEGRTGLLARLGLWLTGVSFAALIVQSVAGIVIGQEYVLGPLYPIGALLSRLGLILWAIATYRADVLPRWLGPVLALAWVVAPPLGPIPTVFALPIVWTVAAIVPRARRSELVTA